MKTLVIIGAGFSGAVTAAQFLRHSPPGVRVVLINRSGAMARGLAYGTNSSLHLLNVPAGNMSAYADEHDHFLDYCRERHPSFNASTFAPRKIYGDYLVSILDQAERQAPADVIFKRVISEVDSLRADGAGAVLELSNGMRIRADQVVLAFGNFSPLDPPGFSPTLGKNRYQSDPWSGSKEQSSDPDKPVLLVGAGLTALDVAIGLLHQGHRGPIHMVSRRGLRPLPHRQSRSMRDIPPILTEALLKSAPSVREYVRLIRREVKLAQARDLDWRDLLAAIRPVTPDLWKRLSCVERRRFLRHVQSFWDVHRHRVAPAAYQYFSDALEAGQIRSIAGRIRKVDEHPEGLVIDVELRGATRIRKITVARVINCTGPNTDLRCVDDKLITQLTHDGLISLDSLGLGIKVSERLSTMSASGQAVEWLHYIGPMLKSDFWEATAVPELRQHAKALALDLAKKIIT